MQGISYVSGYSTQYIIQKYVRIGLSSVRAPVLLSDCLAKENTVVNLDSELFLCHSFKLLLQSILPSLLSRCKIGQDLVPQERNVYQFQSDLEKDILELIFHV